MHVLENNHHSLHIHSTQVISLSSNNHLERLDLKVKLEKATKQAESVETYAKKAINDAHDAQASGKKAIYKAVASTTNCYKICLDNFVVSLGISGEDKSLEDHVSKLVKAIPFHARAPADMAVEVPGQEEEEDNGQPGDHLAMHVLENNHHSLHIHSPQVISLSSNNHLERLDLKVKLENATKQAESVENFAKKAINDDANDAQASGKKAIYEDVASTTNCYKICLDNFVVSLSISGEDKSLEDHVSKLVKAIPFDARAPAGMAVEVAGQEGDVG
ncbi:hypothetical protein ACET3Z_026296 [Daucus carota]